MVDIGIFKYPYDLQDRIDFTDICEKFISKPFTLARSLYETCDVDKLDGGRDDLLTIDSFSEFF